MSAVSPLRICGALLACGAGVLAYQQITGSPRLGYSPARLAEESLRRLWDNDEAGAIAGLRRAVAGDAANPFRWCDLGEALLQAGQEEEAVRCMRAALKRSPASPQVMTRMAAVLFETGKTSEALQVSARALARTSAIDRSIFLSFAQFGPGVGQVLAEGIGDNRRAAEAYLLDLVSRGKPDDAALVWSELMRRSWASNETASTYAHLAASRGWRHSAAGALRFLEPSYAEGNWVFNGDFETAPSNRAYDWTTVPCQGARMSLDHAIRSHGRSSLRIEFSASAEADFHHVAQALALEPGTYELSARIRTEALESDNGIRFHLIAPGPHPKVDVWTEGVRGSTEWTTVKRTFQAGPAESAFKLDVVRFGQPFPQEIGGTAWIDAVKLVRVAE